MTKEQATAQAKQEADERGIEMVVLHNPKAADPDNAYSVGTKGQALSALANGHFQVSCYRPGWRDASER